MNKMLSEHFSAAEFQCPHCKQLQIDMRLIKALEELRNKVSKPLKITSGYRCAEHNKAVGGAQASEHTKGQAADVACPPGVRLDDFYQMASSIKGITAIGVYPEERFLHVDVREKKARWARIDGKYVAVEAAFKKGTA
jgi:uncharacterized protein YcbK (DUF882 family)